MPTPPQVAGAPQTFGFTASGTVLTYTGGGALGPAVYDLLAVNSDNTVATPAGWTSLRAEVSNQGAYLFVRPAAATTATIDLGGGIATNTLAQWVRVADVAGVDVTAGQQATGLAATTPALTTPALAEADELVLAFAALHGFDTTPTAPAWSTGYTPVTAASQGTGNAGVYGAIGSKAPAGPAAESPVLTWTNNATDQYMLVVSFTALDDAITGDGALTLPALLVDGAAAVTTVGDGAVTLPGLTVAGTGTVTPAEPADPVSGDGVITLPALTVTGVGEIPHGCEQWPYDPSCLPAGWSTALADLTAAQRSSYDFAVELLADRTLRQFGVCVVNARPCSLSCAVGSGFSRLADGWFTPMLIGGQVYNGCGCQSAAACGCGTAAATVRLDGPVIAVTRVRVDGQVVPPSAYRLDGTLLVRTDGGTWPVRQDLNAPATDPDTFEVQYRRGREVPAGGRRAVSALMVELHKARCGDKTCALPSRVTNVVREGVTYSLLDDPAALLDNGLTGISDVDLWLRAVNPHRARTRMRVYSPDLRRR